MALKSILSIEVEDGAFLKFQAQFKAYEEAVKKSGSSWDDVTKRIDGSKKSFDELVAAASVRLQRSKLIADAEKVAADQLKRQTGETTTQARSWSSMAKDTKSFAANIGNATTSLLRWASITGIISGIVGAGGLFGIDRLAITAGNQRRSSLGLGVTPGEQSSFGVNFGRVVNPDQFLGGVNEALHDVTKRTGLYGAGLHDSDIAGKDTAQVAAQLLPALKRLADQTPEKMLGNILRARHLDQFITLEDFERLKHTPGAEIADYGRRYASDIKGLDLSKGQAKAWQDLQVQFDRAGKQIEKTFIVGLAPLAPKLEHLSQSFSGLIDAFLRNPETARWIDTAADALDHFATYIGTNEFKENVKDFVKGIGNLAHSIVSGLKLLHVIPDDSTPEEKEAKQKEWDVEEAKRVQRQKEWDAAHPPDILSKPMLDLPRPSWVPSWLGGAGAQKPPTDAPKRAPGSSGGSFHDYEYVTPGAFRPGNFKGGITPALLASVEYEESKGRDLTNRKSGAAGYFQFIPSTARQYGVDVHNEQSSLDGARRYLTDLKNMFGGDTEKALAAYNWGPGNLKKDIAKYGDQWRDHLPAETKKYVSDITGRLPKEAPSPPTKQPYGHANPDRSMRVTISNQTGGNANVTVAALGAA